MSENRLTGKAKAKRSKASMPTQQRGRRGEAIAAAALERAGYTITDRNWRCVLGELDLVARHRDEIVFVEVRARYDGIDTALESIGPRKQRQLARLAEAYLAAHQLVNTPYRIDVVAVDLAAREPTVEIVENAVGW